MKISIITAAYNSGATLRDTMKSVLAQDYQDWEHIIVDGASSDNSLEIIREMEPLYKGRMKWISEPDKGIYDAMNKGIAMATGDVIGILNSDDFFSAPDVLSSIASVLKDPSIEAVYGDIHYVHPENLKKCVRYYSSSRFVPWQMKLGFMPAHPSFYCRRDVYVKYGLFDISFQIAADFEQLLRLLYLHKIHTRYIPRDFVTMRIGGASTSGFKSHRRIFTDHLEAYRKNGVKSNFLLEGLRYLYKAGQLVFFKLNMSKYNKLELQGKDWFEKDRMPAGGGKGPDREGKRKEEGKRKKEGDKKKRKNGKG